MTPAFAVNFAVSRTRGKLNALNATGPLAVIVPAPLIVPWFRVEAPAIVRPLFVNSTPPCVRLRLATGMFALVVVIFAVEPLTVIAPIPVTVDPAPTKLTTDPFNTLKGPRLDPPLKLMVVPTVASVVVALMLYVALKVTVLKLALTEPAPMTDPPTVAVTPLKFNVAWAAPVTAREIVALVRLFTVSLVSVPLFTWICPELFKLTSILDPVPVPP